MRLNVSTKPRHIASRGVAESTLSGRKFASLMTLNTPRNNLQPEAASAGC